MRRSTLRSFSATTAPPAMTETAREHASAAAAFWPASSRVEAFLDGDEELRAAAVTDARDFIDALIEEVMRRGGAWSPSQIAQRAAAEAALIAAQGGPAGEARFFSRHAVLWSRAAATGAAP